MANPNNYYVDPAINANSGTGTLGDPFGDLQYALNNITRSTTVGDQINIKAGTAEVMSSAITLATYGTPTTSLIFAGYNSAANDGGIGEITFAGNNTNVFAATYNQVHFKCMKIGSFGTGSLNMSGTNCSVLLSEIHTFSGNATIAGNLISSHIHTHTGGAFCVILQGAVAFGNLIRSQATRCLYGNAAGCQAVANVIVQSAVGNSGIEMFSTGSGYLVLHNSIINTAAGTGAGIVLNSTTHANQTTVANNIIQGWSGAGGAAIKFTSATRPVAMIRNNRWFNCTSGISGSDYLMETDNSSLASSPFTDVSNLDFRVSSAVSGIGWPSALLSAPLSTNFPDLGALQRSVGGGIPIVRGMHGGMR